MYNEWYSKAHWWSKWTLSLPLNNSNYEIACQQLCCLHGCIYILSLYATYTSLAAVAARSETFISSAILFAHAIRLLCLLANVYTSLEYVCEYKFFLFFFREVASSLELFFFCLFRFQINVWLLCDFMLYWKCAIPCDAFSSSIHRNVVLFSLCIFTHAWWKTLFEKVRFRSTRWSILLLFNTYFRDLLLLNAAKFTRLYGPLFCTYMTDLYTYMIL